MLHALFADLMSMPCRSVYLKNLDDLDYRLLVPPCCSAYQTHMCHSHLGGVAGLAFMTEQAGLWIGLVTKHPCESGNAMQSRHAGGHQSALGHPGPL